MKAVLATLILATTPGLSIDSDWLDVSDVYHHWDYHYYNSKQEICHYKGIVKQDAVIESVNEGEDFYGNPCPPPMLIHEPLEVQITIKEKNDSGTFYWFANPLDNDCIWKVHAKDIWIVFPFKHYFK